MVAIPQLDPSEAPRARRWDALILGSGLSALVAAARISAAGQRVLVVEEEARAKLPATLKEPFFLSGLRDQGILDATLRTLNVPLIDRRRIANERLAYQVAKDPYRLDVGQPLLMAEEFVSWGLAKPDEAQTLVRRLVEASEIERTLLFESPFVRIGRRSANTGASPARATPTPAAQPHRRGLPGEVAEITGPLRELLDAQIRALSNLATRIPSPEARARLWGLGLAGGAGFSDDPPWLLDLLRKRLTSLYGDMRRLPGAFELVQVSGQPGIRVIQSGEIWLGRALVIAAAPSALRDAHGSDPRRPAPDQLAPAAQRAYRAVGLFRISTESLPEGMGARLILPGSTGTDTRPSPTLTVTAFPSQTHPQRVDLIARAVLTDVTPAELDERLAAFRSEAAGRIRALMPFSGDGLESVDVDLPIWDSDDGWLEDPAQDGAWPAEIDLRISSKPQTYHLDRAAAAGLGFEGDLLLGWRGGDALARALG